MFGLMKATSCKASKSDRETRRMHYCGTCKTIGRMYSQKARAFLNYDAVFLGELLSAIQPQAPTFCSAYVSRNCFSLPSEPQAPWPLRYAATANVVLAQFKILDHIVDSKSMSAKLANKLCAREFIKAKKQLLAWNFPLDELFSQLDVQVERESEFAPTLDRLSEPTAVATQLMFEHGATQSGASLETTETMAKLGRVFGQIAYIADAVQDREKDKAEGAFNALSATDTSDAAAVLILKAKRQEMLGYLESLPIQKEQKETFILRLRANLAPLLAGNLVLANSGSNMPIPPRSDGRGQITSVSVRRRNRCGACGPCSSWDCCDACNTAMCCCDVATCCDAGACCC